MMSSDAPRTPFTLLTADHFTRLAPLTVRVHRDDTLYSAVADVPEILHRVTWKRVSDLDERQKSQYDLVRCYMIIYENDVERDCIRLKKEHKYQEALRKKAEEDRMEGQAVSSNTKATTERSRLGKSSEACQRPVSSDGTEYSLTLTYPPSRSFKWDEERETSGFVERLLMVLQNILFFAQLLEDPKLPQDQFGRPEGNVLDPPGVSWDEFLPEAGGYVIKLCMLLKSKGAGNNATNYIRQVYEHTTDAVPFKEKPEYRRLAECFNPDHPFDAVIEDINAIAADPDVAIQQTTHAIAVELFSDMVGSISRAVVATNGIFDALLCRSRVDKPNCDVYLSLFSIDRQPEDFKSFDMQLLVNFFAYATDGHMMPFSTHLFHHPVIRPRTPLPTGAGLGRPMQIVPPCAAFSTCSPRNPASVAAEEAALQTMSHLSKLAFTFNLVDDHLAIHISGRHAWLKIPAIAVHVVGSSPRQGVFRRSTGGLICVKVYPDEAAFLAETKALTTLLSMASVPRLIGAGTTGGGNKFVVVGQAAE
ncbi:hypothetical protein NMY22_g7311 [Coprinellus aureogranulatus]|nr:hypothetical protein NMY22_g7311 [Coprinellus aureogranulatus]